MAVVPQLVLLLSLTSRGECVHVLLGDPVTFPETENCPGDQPGELSLIGHPSATRVAYRERGVWTPVRDYEDRGIQGASFAFSSTVYTDTGLYELECGRGVERIHLSVLPGSEASVSEGGPARLTCYIIGQHVDSIRWEKGQETVLELNLSSGGITYGPASDGTLSLSREGTRGDYSLHFSRVHGGHEGGYFCSARTNGAWKEWGRPAAWALKVTDSSAGPTLTGSTSRNETTKSVTGEERTGTWTIVFITAAVVLVIVAPSCLLLGWYLKSRCSGTQTRSGSLLFSPLKLINISSPPKSKDNQI